MRNALSLTCLVSATLFASDVQAAVGHTINRFHLFAGPGLDYPRIVTVPDHARIVVHGCLGSFDWCDVSYGDQRGWIDGNGVELRRDGSWYGARRFDQRYRLPRVTFEIGDYWRHHYRQRNFYRDRARYFSRHDRDHDGIPNRFDRDRDNDGIPNKYDRDKDGDGIPNRYDSSPNNSKRY